MEHEVRFLPSGRVVRVPAGTPLLEAARQAGLPVASACGGDGVCGRCGLRVLGGVGALTQETDRERRSKRANRVDPGLRLSCRAALAGDCTVSAPYW